VGLHFARGAMGCDRSPKNRRERRAVDPPFVLKGAGRGGCRAGDENPLKRGYRQV